MYLPYPCTDGEYAPLLNLKIPLSRPDLAIVAKKELPAALSFPYAITLVAVAAFGVSD